MTEMRIDDTLNGMRLDKAIAKRLRAADSGFIHKMLRKKNIVLNGKKADGATRVETGDVVTLYLSDETIAKFSAENDAAEKLFLYRDAYEHLRGDDEQIAILYEDDALLLLNKPVGVLSQRSGNASRSVNEWLCGYLLATGAIDEASLLTFRPSVANRLDRNTSGVVVCAKTLQAARAFSALQRAGALTKRYLAVAQGVVTKETRVRETVVKRKDVNRVKTTGSGDPAHVSLVFRPVAVNRAENASLLEIDLFDGKTHQIRAQLARAAHPVIGDYKYGDRKINDDWKARFRTHSQLLCARTLIFPEITDGALRAVSGRAIYAPLPEKMRRVCLETFQYTE